MPIFKPLKFPKAFWVFIAIFIAISVYIQFLDGQRTKKITKVATPILQLCQTNHQCPDEKTVEANREKFLLPHEIMDYTTVNQRNNFTINWRVATGVSFIATGGVNEPLQIQKEMD